ncbi:MAG: hypothetical protein WD267_09295 [Balneolales bacterium]
MKNLLYTLILIFGIINCQNTSGTASNDNRTETVDEQKLPLSAFNVYRGNTHAHTIITWTHGPQREKFEGPFNMDWQAPPGTNLEDHTTLSMDPDDYNDQQGLPANHFKLAKENGYDFYVTTDHSQEPTLQPAVADNPFWINTLEAAAAYDDDPEFVALTGFEFSRNTDEDGSRGHINPINMAEYVNADHRGGRPAWPEANWSIPQFYDWLKTAKPAGGEGTVVASFNHPGENQYGDWDHIDDEIVEKITLFELHTNYRGFRLKPYLRALNKGWKVSPVGSHDNHSYDNIVSAEDPPPTLVLAPELTKEAITRAMSERRTYVSWNEGTELKYSVNDHIMGSTLDGTDSFNFQIEVKTPAGEPDKRVRRIQILRDHPEEEDDVEVVAEAMFNGYVDKIVWNPTVVDSTAKYFLLRIHHNNDITDEEFNRRGSTFSGPVWTGK